MYAHRENDRRAYSVAGTTVQNVPDGHSPQTIPKCGRRVLGVNCPTGGLVLRQIRLSTVGLLRVAGARLPVEISIHALRCVH